MFHGGFRLDVFLYLLLTVDNALSGVLLPAQGGKLPGTLVSRRFQFFQLLRAPSAAHAVIKPVSPGDNCLHRVFGLRNESLHRWDAVQLVRGCQLCLGGVAVHAAHGLTHLR